MKKNDCKRKLTLLKKVYFKKFLFIFYFLIFLSESFFLIFVEYEKVNAGGSKLQETIDGFDNYFCFIYINFGFLQMFLWLFYGFYCLVFINK